MLKPTVLVADVDAGSRELLAEACAALSCVVVTAASFQEARFLMARLRPAVLVAPLRLREYNAIHLAMAARAGGIQIQTIILGYPDVVLQRDAESAGAMYLADSDTDTVVRSVSAALARVSRRWPRARVELEGAIAGAPVRIVDVSYGGLRMQASCSDLKLNTPLMLVVGDLRVDAIPVWSRGDDEQAGCLYGATLATSEQASREWQALVDAALHGSR